MILHVKTHNQIACARVKYIIIDDDMWAKRRLLSVLQRVFRRVVISRRKSDKNNTLFASFSSKQQQAMFRNGPRRDTMYNIINVRLSHSLCVNFFFFLRHSENQLLSLEGTTGRCRR